MLLFRSDCTACRATKPAWAALVAILDSTIMIHAVSVEPSFPGRTFLDSPRVEFWHVPAASDLVDQFSSPVVPVTIFVESTGVVAYARVGRIGPPEVEAIARLAGQPVRTLQHSESDWRAPVR